MGNNNKKLKGVDAIEAGVGGSFDRPQTDGDKICMSMKTIHIRRSASTT